MVVSSNPVAVIFTFTFLFEKQYSRWLLFSNNFSGSSIETWNHDSGQKKVHYETISKKKSESESKHNIVTIYLMITAISGALRDLVPFVQFICTAIYHKAIPMTRFLN